MENEPHTSKMPMRRRRGTRTNPVNTFEPIHVELDPALLDENERRAIATEYFVDPSQSILSKNESPDVPFTYGMNPYRGCEHGCPYCYARPTHEYLGLSAGLDFESVIFVKPDAPRLLSAALQRQSWTPQPIALSGVTDPYQPVERELRITRSCLKVFLRHRNPVSIVTKGGLITRDLDVLTELARRELVHVHVSITTLRDEVAGAMEPRAARPARRLKVVEKLSEMGVPVGVLIAPVVPGLTDEEVPQIVDAVAQAGAAAASYQLLRLPGPVEELFIEWLERSFPHRKDKVIRRLRALRGGSLSESRFGKRMRGEGEWARLLHHLFDTASAKAGLSALTPLSTRGFRRLRGGQLSFFT